MRVEQVMVLFVRVRKGAPDLAINLVPVAANLGVDPSFDRTEPVRKDFALIVRAEIPITHQHLACLWKRVSILPRFIVILEACAGFEIARIGAATRLLRQDLIQIRSHL